MRVWDYQLRVRNVREGLRDVFEVIDSRNAVIIFVGIVGKEGFKKMLNNQKRKNIGKKKKRYIYYRYIDGNDLLLRRIY